MSREDGIVFGSESGKISEALKKEARKALNEIKSDKPKSNWKLVSNEMPPERKLVLLSHFGSKSEDIATGYWSRDGSHLNFYMNGNLCDDEDPIWWCEIPE